MTIYKTNEWKGCGKLNPIILRRAKPYESEEGCLSLDGVRKRKCFQKTRVWYLDEHFQQQIQGFEGTSALFSPFAALKPIIYDEEQVRYLHVGGEVSAAFRPGTELRKRSRRPSGRDSGRRPKPSGRRSFVIKMPVWNRC